jgi:retinol dehydrogenase-12
MGGSQSFTTADIPDLSGKVAIVTGGYCGIGKVTSLELAKKGCHVILACRSKERTEPVVEEIKKETSNDNVEFLELDLSSLASVQRFAKQFRSKGLPLHLLINNAGVMACPFKLSADNIELQFATNHVGHFYLTTLLLDIIEASAPARIVNLSSMAHKMASSLDLENLNDKDKYAPWGAYGRSKLANIFFTRELASRLADKQVYVNAVHPGYVNTELQRNFSDLYGSVAQTVGNIASSLFAMSPEKGALTSLYVATSPDIEKNDWRGQYFVPIAKWAKPSKLASDEDLPKELWQWTENVIQEKLNSSSGEEGSSSGDKHASENEEDEKEEENEDEKGKEKTEASSSS